VASSNTLSKRPIQKKVFTVAEANATLPLVGLILRDLVELSRQVIHRRQLVSQLLLGKQCRQDDPYRDELVEIEKDVERESRRVREYVDELRALGVEPDSGVEGSVDFPTMLNGRKVFLNWKLGEPQILYWHDTDSGHLRRQPLPRELHRSASGDVSSN
jgi:hypothetical protein